MTDVLIVCVREDEVQAKALADMFEGAGFSVGGAPADDAALRACAAVVVVWSQASIRSRPFLDAAQRVVNAGKGVVACLIDPPPASSLNQSPAFDLRAWAGDPQDPALDPLFFAVDRMASAAGVNPTPPAQAQAPTPAPRYEAPPPAQQPPVRSRASAAPANDFGRDAFARAAPQPQPAPPPRRRGAAGLDPEQDQMNAEALRWRAIRHSRDPAAFLHYLAEYGPDGAFSELAELRLKQLQDANATPLKAAARAVTQNGANGAGSLRRAAESTVARRGAEPPRAAPLRAVEPPPAPAAYAPPPARVSEPPPRMERPAPAAPLYREAAPYREPSREINFASEPAYRGPARTRSGGGAARAVAIFLLLGAGAIGAGMYFGVGEQFGLGAQTAGLDEEADPAADTPRDDAETPSLIETADAAPFDAEAVGGPTTSLAAAAAPVSAAPEAPPRREEPRRAPATPRFEPVGADTPDSVPLMPQPIAPAPQQVAALSGPLPRPTIIQQAAVVWRSRASADQFAAAYPRAAQRQGIGGQVALNCLIGVDYAAECVVASETPTGMGFGDAALRVSRSFRAQPALADGSASIGARAALRITFRPETR